MYHGRSSWALWQLAYIASTIVISTIAHAIGGAAFKWHTGLNTLLTSDYSLVSRSPLYHNPRTSCQVTRATWCESTLDARNLMSLRVHVSAAWRIDTSSTMADSVYVTAILESSHCSNSRLPNHTRNNAGCLCISSSDCYLKTSSHAAVIW